MKLESHLPKQTFWLYLGPVLNVLLILLIFFLLGSSFVIQSGVSVKLPESGFPLRDFHHPLVATVTANSDQFLYLEGRPVSLVDMRKGLEEKKKESRQLIIHADEMAPFGRVQEVANSALSLGYEVAYATQPAR
jgi:biopolymer transport protein ExbD